jgi:hypothetical protein
MPLAVSVLCQPPAATGSILAYLQSSRIAPKLSIVAARYYYFVCVERFRGGKSKRAFRGRVASPVWVTFGPSTRSPGYAGMGYIDIVFDEPPGLKNPGARG